MVIRDAAPLVLASASTARRDMLVNAGVDITVAPADVDESVLKAVAIDAGMAASDLAPRLADAKARAGSAAHPGAWVIGADQVLIQDGEAFDKAPDLAAAAAVLRRLSGRRHELFSAVCVARDGRVVWRHMDRAALWMRPLSDAFIEGYLDQAGGGVLWSVGCYQIEGLGAQLFERIDGDHFTIQGLPLLPLLAFLRQQGLIAA